MTNTTATPETKGEDLVAWILQAILDTQSPEALWCISDAIAADKHAGAAYLTHASLYRLRAAVREQRSKLAEAEHANHPATLPG